MSAAVLLKLLKKNNIKSSSEKQSSVIIVHKPKRTATSTRTIRTRQNKPYRLGAAPAGVVGARSRCCPAATVPAAVVFACGVRCCIAEIAEKKQHKIINRSTELCHHRTSSTEKQSSAIIVHEAKRTATSTRTTHTTQNNRYRLGLAPARVIGAPGRCCPAAKVPVTVVVIARVVCSKKQKKKK